MLDQHNSAGQPPAQDPRPAAAAAPLDLPDNLDTDQLERLAQLVASSEMPLPPVLPPGLEKRLIPLIRQLRRERLVNHISRQVALHLYRESLPPEQSHD